MWLSVHLQNSVADLWEEPVKHNGTPIYSTVTSKYVYSDHEASESNLTKYN